MGEGGYHSIKTIANLKIHLKCMIVLTLVNLTDSTSEEQPLGMAVGIILTVFTEGGRSAHCRWDHSLVGFLKCKTGKCKLHFGWLVTTPVTTVI